MNTIVTELLTNRMVWLDLPEITDLLPRAARAFETEVLANIPTEDLLADRYQLQFDPQLEPDDGIILKHPNKADPSRAVHGVPPDSKVFMQYRYRTRTMLEDKGLYQTAFDPFFELMDEIRSRLDRRIVTLIAELRSQWPGLGATGYKAETSLIRVMKYLDPRVDGSDLAGKLHTDRCDLTCHLYDSVPGLVVEREPDKLELVGTRPGQALVFVADRFTRLSGIPALCHGARDNGRRAVMVMFVHLNHASGA